jgi:5,5'-dehydrodivanillate O-demethylase
MTSAREAKATIEGSNRRNKKYRDFAHIGPGTLAGRFMRTFWHPVYRSEDLPNSTAKAVRLLGEDLTLYRGETGVPHLVGARCKHRGAHLSVGCVEGDCIRCFYHGWMYNEDGQCVEQPAEPKPFTNDIRVLSYPVRDYLGLIFAYLGDSDAPELPRYPVFEDEDAFRMVKITYRGVNFFQDFENGMDRVHGGFVHMTRPRSFDGRVDSPLVRAEEDEWGLKTIAKHPSGKVGVQCFGMPNKQHIKDTFSERENFIWKVPVDDENMAHVRVTVVKGEKAIREEKKKLAERSKRPQLDPFELAKEVFAGRLRREDVDPLSTEMVYFEDAVALLAQGVIAERENEHEYLGASDNPIVLLRNLWEREMRALEEGKSLKQWKYDPDEQGGQIKRVG